MAGFHRRADRHSSHALLGATQDRHRDKIEAVRSAPMRWEAVTCGWLSFVVVASLAAQWLTGAWWVDGVGSLAIVYFWRRKVVKLGRGTNASAVLDGRAIDICGRGMG